MAWQKKVFLNLDVNFDGLIFKFLMTFCNLILILQQDNGEVVLQDQLECVWRLQMEISLCLQQCWRLITSEPPVDNSLLHFSTKTVTGWRAKTLPISLYNGRWGNS